MYSVCVCFSVVLDSPVTEQEFLEQLHELNSKINYAKELSFRETLACSDIQDIVDRLKIKVRALHSSTDVMMEEMRQALILFTGRLEDPWVHPAEDLLLQKAHDQLPDPSEHTTQVQVHSSTGWGFI